MKTIASALLGMIALAAPCAALGQTLYWRTASGTWSTAPTSPAFNWAGTATGAAALEWTDTDSAEITTANPTITLSGTVKVNMLTIDNGMSLKGTSGILDIDGGGSGTLTVSGTTALDVYLNGTSAWNGTLATSAFPGRFFLENDTATGTSTKIALTGDGRLALDAGTINKTVTIGELSANLAASTISVGSGTVGTRALKIDQATNTTYAGTITDSTGTGRVISIIKAGVGTLAFSNAGSNYVGGTTITGGILSVISLANGGANSSIGAGTSAASNLVLNGGTLQYTGAATSTDHLFTVGTSGGTLDASGTGAVAFTNTGTIADNGQSGARLLTLTGSNTGGNSLAAVVADSGGATGLAKSGAGKWIVSGANTYTGATSINGGTLVMNGVQSGAIGLVTVASGATLAGTGTLGGATTVHGTISAGDGGTGILSLASGLTLASDGQALFDINGTSEGSLFDSIHVGGNVVYGGLLTIDLGYSFTGSQSFQLFTVAGGESGAFSSIQFTGTGYTGSFDAATGLFTATAVPEPSVTALAAVGLLACAYARRRSSVHINA